MPSNLLVGRGGSLPEVVLGMLRGSTSTTADTATCPKCTIRRRMTVVVINHRPSLHCPALLLLLYTWKSFATVWRTFSAASRSTSWSLMRFRSSAT